MRIANLSRDFDPLNSDHLAELCAIFQAMSALWEKALEHITEVPYTLTRNPFSDN